MPPESLNESGYADVADTDKGTESEALHDTQFGKNPIGDVSESPIREFELMPGNQPATLLPKLYSALFSIARA